MKLRRTMTASLLAASMFVSGCATTMLNPDDRPLTSREKIARCVGMVAVGALAGAIIGNNVGNGSAGKGAMIGALAGSGACGVWLAFENEADKRRLAELQNAAGRTGRVQTSSWTNAGGRMVSATVTPSTQTEIDFGSEKRICRPTNTVATVDGKSETNSGLICRDSTGAWAETAAPKPKTA